MIFRLTLTLTGRVETVEPLRCMASLRVQDLFLELTVLDAAVLEPLRGHEAVRHLEVRGRTVGNGAAELAASLPNLN